MVCTVKFSTLETVAWARVACSCHSIRIVTSSHNNLKYKHMSWNSERMIAIFLKKGNNAHSQKMSISLICFIVRKKKVVHQRHRDACTLKASDGGAIRTLLRHHSSPLFMIFQICLVARLLIKRPRWIAKPDNKKFETWACTKADRFYAQDITVWQTCLLWLRVSMGMINP